MKKVMLSEDDLSEFLIYCISFELVPTCINRIYAFQDRPNKFVFKLKKDLPIPYFEYLKKRCPSIEAYKPF